MKNRSLIFIILCFIFSQSVFAIDSVYEGEDGIRAKVFETNCLACHSSELSGSQRNNAPSGVNFDTFLSAIEKADRAVVRSVDRMNMPPSFFGLPTLDQEQKDAMLAWQQAGFPENLTTQTNATYDFNLLLLTLPVVNVGESTFVATLKLISLPGSSFGFGFILETADLIEESSATAASFIPATGVVEIPLVDLLNSGENLNPKTAKLLLR